MSIWILSAARCSQRRLPTVFYTIGVSHRRSFSPPFFYPTLAKQATTFLTKQVCSFTYIIEDNTIGFANWIAARPEVTATQLHALDQMRLFLQNLPAPPPPYLNGEFGFEFHRDDVSLDEGHLGAWEVSVCRAGFEIFTVVNDDLDGFSWELCPGHVNDNDLSHAGEWIEQVSAPEKLLLPGQHIVIQASTWSVIDE